MDTTLLINTILLIIYSLIIAFLIMLFADIVLEGKKFKFKSFIDNIFDGGTSLFIVAVVFFFLLITLFMTCKIEKEVKTTSETTLDTSLVSLNLATGEKGSFYMLLGSGQGSVNTDFVYFYYIEKDGKYIPQKSSMDGVSLVDTTEAPRVVKNTITNRTYKTVINSPIGDFLGINFGTTYENTLDREVTNETIFYIPKDKIENKIDPNLK